MQIDVQNLPEKSSELKALILKIVGEYESMEKALRSAQADLLMSRSRLYGRKADFVDPRAVPLFNEAEEAVASDPAAPQDLATEDTEEAKPEAKHKKRGKRRPIPDHIPRVEQFMDLPAEEKICSTPGCGCDLKKIGEEVSESLDYIPSRVTAIRTTRPKYACPKCEESGVKIAPTPELPIPKSLAGPGLLAHIAIAKYMDALPLYRQEAIFKRIGIEMSRTSMARWMIAIADLLSPVVDGLQKKIMEGPLVQSDETRIQVLKEPNKAVGSDCYMWVMARHSDSPAIVFNFDRSRSKQVPLALFAGYKGYIQADGYSGYDELGRWEGIKRVGCWAHARRKFTDSLKIAGDKRENTIAFQYVLLIRELYKIESEIINLLAEEKFKIRQEKAVPILNKIRKWLDDHLPQVSSSSPTGKALTYINNEWQYLIRYVDDGILSIDNNFAERAIRPFAIGRKNWMFADTPAGANASAKIYSIIESAKANGVEPFEYMKHLLKELPTSKSQEQIERLLPWNYAHRHLN